MIIESNIKTDNPFYKKIEYVENKEVIGYLEYLYIYDRIEIENIFVNIENRNQKIGTKLMAKLISIAIDDHLKNITLEVNENNIYAIKLYKNFGFIEVSKRKNYYGQNDGILMELDVM